MKIATRLWLYIIAVVVAVLAMVWIFQIVLLPERYFKEATDRLESVQNEIMRILEHENVEKLSEDCNNYLVDISQNNDLRLELRLPDGGKLFFFGVGSDLSLLSAQELEMILNGDYITKRFQSTGYGELLVIAQALNQNGRVGGVLTISTPVAPVEDTLGVLKGQLFLVIMFSFVLATAFALMIAGVFVRPIREIEQVAKAVSQGDYHRKAKADGKGELGELARTINNMSEQLGQIEELRRGFIATVSHQFKTPLSIIQGHTELMADTIPPELSDRLKPQFDIILQEVSKLDTMAKDVLLLSKMENERAQIDKQTIQLEIFCRDICDKLCILDDNIKLTCKIPKEITVNAEIQGLSHVIENLVQNAFCHANAENIVVSASSDGNTVTVSVKDDGVGLTAEQCERVWERFYKGDSKKRTGSGLGMSIVKEVLDAHGAKYGVNSELGKGTEVWFTMII